ncbi:MAG TPA: hypothetical protein VM681_02015, partial [Candidatus Thermoplasmatota archaeon]|nr:hypothetical protein [Candidatus Thermoplasmatota archaeon]
MGALRKARSHPRVHAYEHDGEARVAAPIHARWYSQRGILELNERLRSPPVALKFKAMARELPAIRRGRLTAEALALTRELMTELYRRTERLVDAHLRNYPLPELDSELFASPVGRRASERYL